MSEFVVNRLRSNPVEYTVTISHFVSNGEWKMSCALNDVTEDEENKKRIAYDLRYAAELLEKSLEEGA